MLDGPIDLPTNCRAATVTHVRFLTRNICHTKRISDSREKKTRLVRNEKRLARNETCLASNKTRGGNLPLSGTVHLDAHVHVSKLFFS